MDWAVIPPNIPYLLGGLWVSVKLATVTIAFSFPLGCLIAVGRLSRCNCRVGLAPQSRSRLGGRGDEAVAVVSLAPFG